MLRVTDCIFFMNQSEDKDVAIILTVTVFDNLRRFI